MVDKIIQTPARELLHRCLEETQWNMKTLAEELELNTAYFHQYLTRGSPKVLREDIREALARIFSKNERDFRDTGTPASPKGFQEDPAIFKSEDLSEARKLGLDPKSIANNALQDALKRARMAAWIEENKDAFAANRRDIQENGLWSDGLRQF